MAEWQTVLADDVQSGNVVAEPGTDRIVQVESTVPGPLYGATEIILYARDGAPVSMAQGQYIEVFR